MEDSYYKKQTLRPFLIVSGVFLAIAGAIQFHSAIVEIVALASDGYYNRWYSIAWTYTSAEYIAGEVSFFVGLISITTIIALIGRVFDNEKQQTRTTILLLVFFIALQALRDFHPDFITWGQEWGGLAILLIYALIRGITFNNVSRQLNVPAVKYGGVLFSLYAWTFLITFIIVLITAVIYVATQSLEVGYYALLAGIWVSQIQLLIDGITWGGIGLKFLVDARNKPKIESKIAPRTAPAITTGVELGMGQYNTKRLERPAILDEYPVTEEEILLKHCTHCGAQNLKGNIHCDNCGQKID